MKLYMANIIGDWEVLLGVFSSKNEAEKTFGQFKADNINNNWGKSKLQIIELELDKVNFCELETKPIIYCEM